MNFGSAPVSGAFSFVRTGRAAAAHLSGAASNLRLDRPFVTGRADRVHSARIVSVFFGAPNTYSPLTATTWDTPYWHRRQLGLSASFDLEDFRRTTLLACEREFLEFTEEQNWCDTDNDHFRSAIRTRRRSPYFGWRFLVGHVVSFREARATDTWWVPVVELKNVRMSCPSISVILMEAGLQDGSLRRLQTEA